MNVSEILNKAADLIEPQGAWVQGKWSTDGGKCLCAEGAIAIAAELSFFTAVEGSPAGRALAEFIGDPIPVWNDAPDRTQAEVVAALRAAARKAEQS